jgi:hypothetical protein
VAAEEPYLELKVLGRIREAMKPRAAWEAEFPEESPLSDEWVMLQNWASLVHTLGMILANLAVSPDTREELMSDMKGMVNRAPAWLEAQFEGQQEMTWDLFLHGLAETLAKQRAGIERVIDEQASDPAPIEETLAGAPVPAGTESRSVLFPAVGEVVGAHTKALVDIAYDLELQARRGSD